MGEHAPGMGAQVLVVDRTMLPLGKGTDKDTPRKRAVNEGAISKVDNKTAGL